MLAALGTEQGAGRLSALEGAQAQVGRTRLAQSPVALGQLGQLLGIQQGLAAGGHGGGHGRGCRDSDVVGILASSLPPAHLCLGHPRVGGEEAWWGCFVLVGSPGWGRGSENVFFWGVGGVFGVRRKGLAVFRVGLQFGQDLKRMGICLGRVTGQCFSRVFSRQGSVLAKPIGLATMGDIAWVGSIGDGVGLWWGEMRLTWAALGDVGAGREEAGGTEPTGTPLLLLLSQCLLQCHQRAPQCRLQHQRPPA